MIELLPHTIDSYNHQIHISITPDYGDGYCRHQRAAAACHEMASSANANQARIYQDATHFEFNGAEFHGGQTFVSREYASPERYVSMGY